MSVIVVFLKEKPDMPLRKPRGVRPLKRRREFSREEPKAKRCRANLEAESKPNN